MQYDKDHPHEFVPAYATIDAWKTRADALRQQIHVALGLLPLPEKCAMNPIVTGTINRGDHMIDRVYFTSVDGHYVSGNLYRPAKIEGLLPAVLCPHGHWKDGRLGWASDDFVARELKSGGERFESAARNPLQARGVTLARNGFIALVYDMIGYGDSRAIEHMTGFTDLDAILRGESFMGLQTWNGVRAFDFLASLDYVDPKRIGITGASSGGMQTLMLSAVDDRLACAFAGAMISATMQGGCICENAPLVRIDTNNVEIAALFAPKPFGFATAQDWTRDFIADGFPKVQLVYKLFNASDKTDATFVPFGHNDNSVSRHLGYQFLRKHLQPNQTSPIEETDFTPSSPSELSVWTVDHPMPNDAADAATLRRTMRRSITALDSDALALCWKALIVFAHPASDQPAKRSSQSIVLLVADRADKLLLSKQAIANTESVHLDLQSIVGEPIDPTKYAGYVLGYNRTTLASRALAIGEAIAAQRKKSSSVGIYLYCSREFGLAGLIAAAIAGRQVAKSAIDLGGHDFSAASLEDSEALLLPGSLKIGGMRGLLSMLVSPTLLAGAPENIRKSAPDAVQFASDSASTVSPLLDWLLAE